MPGSIRENDSDLRDWVKRTGIETVLDIGPGRGTYARVLKGLDLTMDCIEVWHPYVRKYLLEAKYHRVMIADVRAVAASRFAYDLVIFGDVLEHMSRDAAMDVWKRASMRARYGLISVPIIHYPQGPSHGNPYEEHVQDHLTPTDIRKDYGPFIEDWTYEVTGTFIKDFRR